MRLTPGLLVDAVGCTEARAYTFCEPLNTAVDRWKIKAVPEFLAQCAHESVSFSRLEESLYYTTPERIAAVFRKFDLDRDGLIEPDELAFAAAFVRQPEKLANFVYAGRYGNGPFESGDGWRYRGRGLIQLTFKDNYRAYQDASWLPVVEHPDMVKEPQWAADSAGWYWHSRNIDDVAQDVTLTTKRINGGTNGLKDRLALTYRARRALE